MLLLYYGIVLMRGYRHVYSTYLYRGNTSLYYNITRFLPAPIRKYLIAFPYREGGVQRDGRGVVKVSPFSKFRPVKHLTSNLLILLHKYYASLCVLFLLTLYKAILCRCNYPTPTYQL